FPFRSRRHYSPRDRQLKQPASQHMGAETDVFEGASEAQGGEARQEAGEHRLEFDASQGSSNAKMGAVAKREVRIGLPLDGKAIRLAKDALVAVGRTPTQQHGLALLNEHIADLNSFT